MEEKIILGVDPGTLVMGYAVIIQKGKHTNLLACDVFRLKHIEDHSLRLKTIFDNLTNIIKEYRPSEMAIEAPFFGKNVQSMLKLGRAQGVAIAAAMNSSVKIFEYSPKKIKQSITGNGNASKEQVAEMLQKLLKIEEMPRYFDATDALGAAFCHSIQFMPVAGAPAGNKKKKSSKKGDAWAAFVAKNPERKA